MPVTEERESGVELLDTKVQDVDEEAEGSAVFRTEEPVTIQVGESAGNAVTVDAQYFVAISIDRETNEMEAMMTGMEEINESSVFLSNEDGEVGGGFLQVEGGNVEDAIEEFENEHL